MKMNEDQNEGTKVLLLDVKDFDHTKDLVWSNLHLLPNAQLVLCYPQLKAHSQLELRPPLIIYLQDNI